MHLRLPCCGPEAGRGSTRCHSANAARPLTRRLPGRPERAYRAAMTSPPERPVDPLAGDPHDPAHELAAPDDEPDVATPLPVDEHAGVRTGPAAGVRDAVVDRHLGVMEGARPRSLPALCALVLAAFVAVETGLLLLGLLVTRVLDAGALPESELAFERAVVAHRTPWLDSATRAGTVLGGTETVLALTAAGCLVLFLCGHGPRLPAFLALAVVGETVLFVVASSLLDRLRPPIPHLDPASITSSFPSGHTAATTALWVGLALGLARTRPGQRLRVLVGTLAVVLPLLVLLTRLYRGMHWPTDVAASVLFTLAWLVLLRALLLPGSGLAGQAAERAAPGPDLPRRSPPGP